MAYFQSHHCWCAEGVVDGISGGVHVCGGALMRDGKRWICVAIFALSSLGRVGYEEAEEDAIEAVIVELHGRETWTARTEPRVHMCRLCQQLT
jgi:hypothetical protein